MLQLTDKQTELLQVVNTGNPDGSRVDMRQLLERLSYSPSRDSTQFVIRRLVSKGVMIKAEPERRDGGHRRACYEVTELGKKILALPSRTGDSGIVSEDFLQEELNLEVE